MLLPLLAVGLRFFSFFPSVIDHDESTYIVIAHGILAGKTYLIDLIDTKPIGIFLLYAGFEWLSGDSIWVLRLLAALWIAATAIGLYYLVQHWAPSRKAGMAAACSYIFLTSLFSFYGLVPNTEIYFNLFTVIAFLFTVYRRSMWHDLGAGLSLGLGFMIKYVLLFDAVAMAFLLLWSARHQWTELKQVLLRGLIMMAAFLGPFIMVWMYYGYHDWSDLFLYYTFEVTGRYPVEVAWTKQLLFFLDFIGRFFPVTLAALWVVGHKKMTNLNMRIFFVVWMCLDLAAILLPGKLFGHYFVQLMVPVSLLFGYFIFQNNYWPAWLQKTPRRLGWGLLILLMAVSTILQKKDFFDPPDLPRAVANYLKARLQPNQTIYAGNYHHILYYLLNQQSPSAYVHRSLLWTPEHIHALNINVPKAMQDIFASQPTYVTYEIKKRQEPLESYLNGYSPVDTLFGRVVIYQINSKIR